MGRHKLSKITGDQPNQLNYTIGQKIRLQRNLLGISQKKLAEAIGVTFQQIQKYEKGLNRISVSRLSDISQILGVNLQFFLNAIPSVDPKSDSVAYMASSIGEEIPSLAEENAASYNPEIDFQQLTTRETLQLVKAYYKVQNTKKRRKILDLINLVAQDENNQH